MQDYQHIESLFHLHYERMLHLAQWLLKDSEEARDVVSQVFVQLLDTQPTHVNEAYLLTTVRNRCLNQIMHKRVEERARLLLSIAKTDENPVSAMERERLLDDIEAFINNRLSPENQRIVQMRFNKQMSYQAIGRELNISRVAVYKHLSQALRTLRQHFNPDNHERD